MSTYSRRLGTPLGGPRAVTTARRSPTAGAVTHRALVAPATAAARAGRWAAMSRLTSTVPGAAALWPVAMLTTHDEPSARAETVEVTGTWKRTAEYPSPRSASALV